MTNAHFHNAVIRRAVNRLEALKSPFDIPATEDGGAAQCLRDIDDAGPIAEALADIFVDLCEAAVSEAPDTKEYAVDTRQVRDVLADTFSEAVFQAREWAQLTNEQEAA
jgi:hypothetical protein